MAVTSYAQNFEDIMLWRALKAEKPGFYTDVGAQHHKYDSCTKLFYDRGWRGLNIEPVLHYYELLQIFRPDDVNVRSIVGRNRQVSAFYEFGDTGLSTTQLKVAKSTEALGFNCVTHIMQQVPLSDLLNIHVKNPFHFLKIDVEGAEEDVLKGINFDIHRPWIIVVEATRPLSQEVVREQWEHIVINGDYRFVYFDGLNCFYVSNEQYRRLASHFILPPNVFDDFIRFSDLRRIVQENDIGSSISLIYEINKLIRENHDFSCTKDDDIQLYLNLLDCIDNLYKSFPQTITEK